MPFAASFSCAADLVAADHHSSCLPTPRRMSDLSARVHIWGGDRASEGFHILIEVRWGYYDGLRRD
ncbi:unnamed protein product [Cuscuta europaea]|uniref:Uncharacterized protein n=1 Tax=Cuscuta europaea TaxID=41803 RepID=A0A9P1A1J1_CUSEU|nr:unnamed protein product [Cuscuta europaea]